MNNFEQPIVSLKEDLKLENFLKERRADFEIESPETCEEDEQKVLLESYQDYERLTQSFVNLDLLDEESEDCSPFDKYRRKMFGVNDDGKVLKYVVKEGVGPLPESNSTMYIRYQGYFEYNELPFDSTIAHKGNTNDRPVPFNLAGGGLLPGLQIALLSMRKREKAEFLVHPDLAFGKMGCPPRIPKEATILFIVEVDRFGNEILEKNTDETEMERSGEDRRKYSYLYKIATEHYQSGNQHFNAGDFNAAGKRYSTVVRMLGNAHYANEKEEMDGGRFLTKIFTNLCLCCYKLKKYKRLCVVAAEAMKYYEREACKNHKLLYFWGQAKMMLDDYKGARRHFLAAKKLMPNDSDIKRALVELDRRKNAAIEEEKIMATKSFEFPTIKNEVDRKKEVAIEEEKIMATKAFAFPTVEERQAEIIVKHKDEEEFDEDRFWKRFGGQMEALINSSTEDWTVIEDPFSKREAERCIQLGEDLGLSVQVVEDTILISKPGHTFQ